MNCMKYQFFPRKNHFRKWKTLTKFTTELSNFSKNMEGAYNFSNRIHKIFPYCIAEVSCFLTKKMAACMHALCSLCRHIWLGLFLWSVRSDSHELRSFSIFPNRVSNIPKGYWISLKILRFHLQNKEVRDSEINSKKICVGINLRSDLRTGKLTKYSQPPLNFCVSAICELEKLDETWSYSENFYIRTFVAAYMWCPWSITA